METPIANATPNTSKRSLTLVSLLSFFGFGISVWQTRQFHETRAGIASFHSFCNIGSNFDCTAIEMSTYAELFRGFPLSVMAMAGYLMIFGISLFAMSEAYQKFSRKVLLTLVSISVLFSLVYLSIMIGSIGKFCLLCLCVDAINLLMLIFAIRLPKAEERGNGMRLPVIGGVGIASSAIAVLTSLALNPQAEMKKEEMMDIVESVLATPVTPITVPADAPFIGNPNAKITIVKFSDFQCPACKLGAEAIHPLFKRYPKDVRFVFINYPLDEACNPDIKHKMHEFACEAAAIAICAADQGKYPEAYEILFENQTSFKAGEIANLLAKVPGLDLAKLKSCMSQPSTSDKIKRDVDLGRVVQIQATPTFFINGKRVEGGLPTNLWMDVIDRMLKQ